MVLEKADGKDGSGFGESVSGVAPATEGLFNLANKVDGRSRAANLNKFKASEIVVVHRRMVDQCSRHCRDHREMGNPLTLDEFEDLLRVEFLDDDVASTGTGDRMRRSPSVDMEKGDGMKLYVGVLYREAREDLHRVQIEISMGHHHAFGIGGRSRGVKELGKVIVVDRWRRKIG